MLMALIGFLILLFTAIIFGTITFPTRDEMILILSSFSLLVMAWFYRKEKREEEK